MDGREKVVAAMESYVFATPACAKSRLARLKATLLENDHVSTRSLVTRSSFNCLVKRPEKLADVLAVLLDCDWNQVKKDVMVNLINYKAFECYSILLSKDVEIEKIWPSVNARLDPSMRLMGVTTDTLFSTLLPDYIVGNIISPRYVQLQPRNVFAMGQIQNPGNRQARAWAQALNPGNRQARAQAHALNPGNRQAGAQARAFNPANRQAGGQAQVLNPGNRQAGGQAQVLNPGNRQAGAKTQPGTTTSFALENMQSCNSVRGLCNCFSQIFKRPNEEVQTYLLKVLVLLGHRPSSEFTSTLQKLSEFRRFIEWYQHTKCQMQSLKHIARLAVRRAMKKDNLKFAVTQLFIPDKCKQYILFSDINDLL